MYLVSPALTFSPVSLLEAIQVLVFSQQLVRSRPIYFNHQHKTVAYVYSFISSLPVLNEFC